MYCAEQINIPKELGAIMKQFTKSVILEEPQDLYKWSANYFAELANMAPMFGDKGEFLQGTTQPISSSGGNKAPPSANSNKQLAASPASREQPPKGAATSLSSHTAAATATAATPTAHAHAPAAAAEQHHHTAPTAAASTTTNTNTTEAPPAKPEPHPTAPPTESSPLPTTDFDETEFQQKFAGATATYERPDSTAAEENFDLVEGEDDANAQQQDGVQQVFSSFDNGEGRMSLMDVPSLLDALRDLDFDLSEQDYESYMQALDAAEDGTVSLADVYALLFQAAEPGGE